MKITGEDSISNEIKKVLQVAFVIGIGLMIIIPILALYYIIKEPNGVTFPFLLYPIGIYITGFPALIILYKFIKLFNLLKENNPFVEDTVRNLKIVSNSSLFISIIYFILIIIAIWIKNIYFVMFSIIVLGVFFVAWISAYILSELFKTANDYKKENDLTI